MINEVIPNGKREWVISGTAIAGGLLLIALIIPLMKIAFTGGQTQYHLQAQERHLEYHDDRIDANSVAIRKLIRRNNKQRQQILIHLQRLEDSYQNLSKEMKYLINRSKQ